MIARIAREQRGVVSRAQLLQEGVTRDEVDWRVKTRRLHPVFRGVYLAGHEVAPPGARELAGTLAAGAGAVASGMSAAALFGSVPAHDGPVEVTVSRHVRARDGLVPRTCRLAPDEVGAFEGDIPVTSPARTLLDIAHRLPEADYERAVADALRRRLTSEQALERLLERHHGQPGTPLLRRILELDSGPAFTRSHAERALLALIRDAGLPAPRVNARVAGRERDFVWPDARLVLELDSSFHDDAIARRADPARDAELLLAGWQTMRVTARQVRDQPHVVVALIAAALSRGCAPRSASGL